MEQRPPTQRLPLSALNDAHLMGQTAKEFVVPLFVLGLMAVGAVQAIQTGNTSTIQRAWAMVR